MDNNQLKTVEALKYAVQMEIDGKKFYNKCAIEAGNRTGKELFTWLAIQEDEHLKGFLKIHDNLTAEKGWPELVTKPVINNKISTLFAQALKETGISVKSDSNEVDSISRALELEIESRNFYKIRASQSQSDVEKSFFNIIASEEQGHYLALIDYQEYLADPTGWFTRTEHHSMDGA